jgi:hypothetical protein
MAGLWLGLGHGGAMDWPRFGPLVGFFPLSWHYAFPNGAFLCISLVLGVHSYKVSILLVQVKFG